MPKLVHPSLDAVPLAVALHALSDPVRLEVVSRLAAIGGLNCTGVGSCGTVPKSTLSHHLSVLRAAGLIETVSVGREKVNTLRRAEFDGRFPGLLDAVLANRDGAVPGVAPGA